MSSNSHPISPVLDLNQLPEENALKNWHKWLRIRKLQHDKLGNSTSREPHCLLMNQDVAWPINREKLVIEDAINYKKPDKYRGHPDFWKISVVEPIGKQTESPIFSPLTVGRQQDFKVKSRDYLGVPDQILEEKGIGSEFSKSQAINKWFSCEAVTEKKNILQQTLKEIDFYSPDIQNLMILGKSRKPQSKKSKRRTISVQIKEADSESNDIGTFPILKIRELVVTPLAIYESSKLLFEIRFTDCDIKENHLQVVKLENLGSIAVRYRWTKISSFSDDLLLPCLPLCKSKTPKFFFNFNDGIIPPGQIIEVEFWFRSKTAGKFGETWELRTRPSVAPTPLTFVLEGLAIRRNISEPWEQIERKLERSILLPFIKNILNGILNEIGSSNQICYGYSHIFGEKDQFLLMNDDLSYDSSIVEELKRLYKQIFKENWSLSVSDFLVNIMESNLSNGEKSKYGMLIRSKIEKLLLLPSFEENASKVKINEYEEVYNILCMAVSKFEKEANELRISVFGQTASDEKLMSLHLTPKASELFLKERIPIIDIGKLVEKSESSADTKASKKKSRTSVSAKEVDTLDKTGGKTTGSFSNNPMRKSIKLNLDFGEKNRKNNINELSSRAVMNEEEYQIYLCILHNKAHKILERAIDLMSVILEQYNHTSLKEQKNLYIEKDLEANSYKCSHLMKQ